MKSVLLFLLLTIVIFACNNSNNANTPENFPKNRSDRKGEFNGYKPSHPIDFPHDKHVGKLGIDCKYCHNTGSESKVTIPSVKICMNCHSSQSNVPKIDLPKEFDKKTTKDKNPHKGLNVEGLACDKCHIEE